MTTGRQERYGDVSVLCVMAAPAEYGEHLRARIQPLMTGIGPVEAAVVLSTALARLEAASDLPDLIVSLGSCGSRVLEHAVVYQASSVAYRDMDASPLGLSQGRDASAGPACGPATAVPHTRRAGRAPVDGRQRCVRRRL